MTAACNPEKAVHMAQCTPSVLKGKIAENHLVLDIHSSGLERAGVACAKDYAYQIAINSTLRTE
jgi:hypothetical protein